MYMYTERGIEEQARENEREEDIGAALKESEKDLAFTLERWP